MSWRVLSTVLVWGLLLGILAIPFVIGNEWLVWGLIMTIAVGVCAYFIPRAIGYRQVKNSFLGNRLFELITLGVPIVIWALPTIRFGFESAGARSTWLPLMVLVAFAAEAAATGPHDTLD